MKQHIFRQGSEKPIERRYPLQSVGVAIVETQGKGGRYHEYLTYEGGQQFLAPFFARAQAGEIATASEVKQAFERRVDHEVYNTTIYRMPDRYGWRKLIPRPRYRRDKEAQGQFKNFAVTVQAALATRLAQDHRPILVVAQDEGRDAAYQKLETMLGSPNRQTIGTQASGSRVYLFKLSFRMQLVASH